MDVLHGQSVAKCENQENHDTENANPSILDVVDLDLMASEMINPTELRQRTSNSKK